MLQPLCLTQPVEVLEIIFPGHRAAVMMPPENVVTLPAGGGGGGFPADVHILQTEITVIIAVCILLGNTTVITLLPISSLV